MRTGLRDVPDAHAISRIAPAELQSCDLSAGRALALLRCAREVASGRVDLHAAEHERGWERLRRIAGVGSWTIEMTRMPFASAIVRRAVPRIIATTP